MIALVVDQESGGNERLRVKAPVKAFLILQRDAEYSADARVQFWKESLAGRNTTTEREET
jgi:hypothetical protein